MCSNFGLQVKFCPSSIFLLRSLLIYDKMKNKDGLKGELHIGQNCENTCCAAGGG